VVVRPLVDDGKKVQLFFKNPVPQTRPNSYKCIEYMCEVSLGNLFDASGVARKFFKASGEQLSTCLRQHEFAKFVNLMEACTKIGPVSVKLRAIEFDGFVIIHSWVLNPRWPKRTLPAITLPSIVARVLVLQKS
jgi:hypothetical protein